MFASRKSYNHFLEFFLLRAWGAEDCEKALKTPAVQEMIKMQPKYDVILLEQFNSDCGTGIAYSISRAPVIALSSCALMPWHYNRIGNPQTPSLTPALFMGHSDKMNFQERLSNWIAHFGLKAMYHFFNDNDANALIKQYIGDHIPDVRELVLRTSMFFVNQHYSLSGAKTLPPNVIELGGIHIKEPQPLDSELEEFLNSAEHGVIYISWGSMIRPSTMPKERITAIVEAVRQLKQKVVWKWEGVIENKPANLYVRKWLPQKDILCNSRVKVFWTHGGLGGSSEAAYCGVPVVATPMYGDQFLNSAALVSRGMGAVLTYEKITKETVLAALKFALKPSTAEAARKISYSYNNRPMSQVDTALYWVEHTIATGGQSLMKPPSTFIPWFIYYNLDIYAVIVALLLVLVTSWVIFLRLVCRSSRIFKVAIKVKKQ